MFIRVTDTIFIQREGEADSMDADIGRERNVLVGMYRNLS